MDKERNSVRTDKEQNFEESTLKRKPKQVAKRENRTTDVSYIVIYEQNAFFE
jgi:hypothetical protein